MVALHWAFSHWLPVFRRAGQPLSYDGYRILRVDVTTPRQLEEIERVGGEILNCTPGVGTMDVLVSAEEEEAVGNLGLATVVLQQDVGALIRQQQAGAVAAVTDAYTDFFLDYHDYDGVGGQVWHLNELAARYPGLASVVSVGTTLEGRTIWGCGSPTAPRRTSRAWCTSERNTPANGSPP